MHRNSLVSSTVLGHDDLVTVQVHVEAEPFYGYGYGYVEQGEAADFFNVFGIDGETYGSIIDPQPEPPDNAIIYGWGYEYSRSISGNSRVKKVTVTVTPQTADTNKTYDLLIHINGEGYSNVFEGTTTSGELKTFSFSVFDCNLPTERDYTLLDAEHTIVGHGATQLSDKDTFLDIVVDVIGAKQMPPKIAMSAETVAQEYTISKKIKLQGTVN